MSEEAGLHHRPALRLLAPLQRSTFRTLWAGMGLSYAGDRLQELAQGWLVATLTGSALAVGGIGVLSAIPMLLMPLGGAVADQADRRRIILAGQGIGALVTAVMAALAFTGRIAVWHIYAWALVSGTVWMVVRPAYKVIITEAVPAAEVRPAVSLNSITETVARVLMNAGGSGLLAWLGLPLAFIFNSLSYLVAALCLWRLRGLGRVAKRASGHLLAEMKDGFRYLAGHKGLLHPLLLTFGGIVIISPTTSLLPTIVQAGGGSIVQLGLLGAAGSLGALLGALYAGARSEGDPLRIYPTLGLVAAGAATVFVLRPLSVTGALALCVLGSGALAQVVWNTSRVPRLAEPAYQARMQSITSMTFTLGGPLGAIWGGAAIDRFGLTALVAGAAVLALMSLAVLVRGRARVAAGA